MNNTSQARGENSNVSPIFLIILVIFFQLSVAIAEDGVLPLRTPNVKVGDWVEMQWGDSTVRKETVISIKKSKNDIIVQYCVEMRNDFDDQIDRFKDISSLSMEKRLREETNDYIVSDNSIVNKKTVIINGKKSNIIEVIFSDGTINWYSDEFTITGVAGIFFASTSKMNKFTRFVIDYGTTSN